MCGSPWHIQLIKLESSKYRESLDDNDIPNFHFQGTL